MKLPSTSAWHMTASSSSTGDSTVQGLYRPFVEHAWSKLQQSGIFPTTTTTTIVPLELQRNESPAKGMPPGSVVRIETNAMMSTLEASTTYTNKDHVMAYARYALLETIVPTSFEKPNSKTDIATAGIQVMNFVIFPSSQTDLPVWGVDLVSLPGGKHLLAMDVQPMSSSSESKEDYNSHWAAWHAQHVQDRFVWGGDMPPEASKFFSPHTLWTRLKEDDSISVIQSQVWDAFCDHLDIYIDLLLRLQQHDPNDPAAVTTSATTITQTASNNQEEYRQYRLKNDPARPMLQSLYGPEWTERVLEQVLFPKLL